MLLSDPEIMRIIIHSLINDDASPDSYSVASTEWADSNQSGIVYVSTRFPHILIEIQYQVNQEFMSRLISYATDVYNRYKELPTVLVTVSKSFSSAEFQNELNLQTASSKTPPG